MTFGWWEHIFFLRAEKKKICLGWGQFFFLVKSLRIGLNYIRRVGWKKSDENFGFQKPKTSKKHAILTTWNEKKHKKKVICIALKIILKIDIESWKLVKMFVRYH